jgi:hypothetical protein
MYQKFANANQFGGSAGALVNESMLNDGIDGRFTIRVWLFT